MNRKKIKQCLRSSMEKQFEQISGYKNRKNEEEIIMKYNFKKLMLPISLATAISFCLLFGIIFGLQNRPETIISLDVNPAIEMKLNKSDKIVEIEAKNDDAKKIIGDMKLKNIDADIAINALIGSMLKNGYLKENSKDNDILLTVLNKDVIKTQELKDKLTKTIKNKLNTNNSKAEILLQENEISQEDIKIAKEYNISVGKAKLINSLSNKTQELSQEKLSKMTIKELMAYLEEKNIDYDDILEIDDDTVEDILDEKEDKEEALKDEQEKIEEQKEKENERLEEQKEKEQEKIEDEKEEEQERIEEQKEKEQERIEEQKEKEQEKIEDEKEEEQERIEEQKEKEQEKIEDEKEKE